MQDSAPRRGLKQINAAKIHAAMVRVAKERCIPFWHTFRTIALNRGSVQVARPKETPPAEDNNSKEPVSIQPSQALLSLKEAAAAPQPAPPEPPSPPPAAKPVEKPSPPPKTIPPNTPVAVLTLDEHGAVISARDACMVVLGWEASALAGQDLRDLLKGALDNEVGQFLERHRAGKNPAGTTHLRVIARRKNGTEFPAMVTAVTWGWDTTVIVNGEAARLTWTAAFRDLTEPGESKKQPAPESKQVPMPKQALENKPAPTQNQPTPEDKQAPDNKPSSTDKQQVPAHQENGNGNGNGVKLLAQFCGAPKSAPPAEKLPEPAPKPSPEKFQANLGPDKPQVISDSLWDEPLPVTKPAAGPPPPASPPPPPPRNETSDGAKRADEELAALRKERDELSTRLNAERERLLNAPTPPREPTPAPPPTESSKRFDEDLAILRQERDELVAKLSSEQLAAGEMKYRLEELEKHLAKASDDLDHVKTELSQQFETELAKVRQERDELNGKVTSEQLVAAELNYRLQELQNQWGVTTSDLVHVRAEVASREQAEAELRGQLATAQEAAYYMEIALKEEVSRREKLSERLQNLSNSLRQEQAERSKRFEQEMTTLRQERDELTAKFTAEQQEATEAARRAEELEARVNRSAAEFERAKTELEKQFAERSAIREQLDTAVVAKKELEGANKRFEEELANLRREQDELHGKLVEEQKAAAESKERAKAVESRLGRNAADADRVKAELEKQEVERERTEAEWREQLDSVQALRARLELTLTEAKERIKRLEIELSDLREERNDLKAKTTVGEETAAASTRKADELQARLDKNVTELEQLKAAFTRQTSERERAQAEGREQLEAAQALGTRLETALGEWRERHRRLEEEQVELRRERGDLKARLGVAQESAAESGRQLADLRSRLDESVAELEQLKAAAAKQNADRERAESRLREHQESAKALSRKLEADVTAAAERNARLKQEVADLRHQRDESTEHADDVDRRLSRTTVQLEQAEAELEKHSKAFQRSEAEWRDQLETANSLAQKFEAAWTETVDRSQRLEEELADFQARLAPGRARKSKPAPKARKSGNVRKLPTLRLNGKAPVIISRPAQPPVQAKPVVETQPPPPPAPAPESGNGHSLINQYSF